MFSSSILHSNIQYYNLFVQYLFQNFEKMFQVLAETLVVVVGGHTVLLVE